ncbi:unnamed protein product [Schistosoma mattheei]|uniref:Uncharacterized protein n=1 Tax=Schistosoma mattheei TaxID=31246 RepID=A0A183Q3D5_9TREM|nr:unnamed protein product [Schistosoma mattheei]
MKAEIMDSYCNFTSDLSKEQSLNPMVSQHNTKQKYFAVWRGDRFANDELGKCEIITNNSSKT